MNQKCDVRLHVTCIIVSHDQFTIELEKVHAQILNKNMTYKYLLFMFLFIYYYYYYYYRFRMRYSTFSDCYYLHWDNTVCPALCRIQGLENGASELTGLQLVRTAKETVSDEKINE